MRLEPRCLDLRPGRSALRQATQRRLGQRLRCPYDNAEPVFAIPSRDRDESISGRKGNTLVECPLQRFFEALPAAASVQVGNVSATGSIREFVRRTQGEACKDFLKGGTARLEMFVKKSAPPRDPGVGGPRRARVPVADDPRCQ